jgi:hypothetical protein
MRYALRNKSKITASLGGGYLQTLIKSLEAHFATHETITEIELKQIGREDLRFIDVKDVNPGNTYRFVILDIKFDVYRLAFKEEIK